MISQDKWRELKKYPIIDIYDYITICADIYQKDIAPYRFYIAVIYYQTDHIGLSSISSLFGFPELMSLTHALVVTSGLVYLVLKLSGYLILFPPNGSGLASLLLVQKWYWIQSATQFRWQECIICDSMCAPIICFLVRIITRCCGSTIWFKGQTIIFEHGYPHEAIWAKTYYWAAFSSMFLSV